MAEQKTVEQTTAEQMMEGLKPDEILVGEQSFEAATDLVIAHAERELLIFDTDLSKGGYASLKRFEAVRAFLAKSRQSRLVIVLHKTDFLTLRCPRLMGLLKTYSHAISICQTCEEARAASDALIIADQCHYLHRFHAEVARFKYALNDPVNVKPLYEWFGELLEASSPSVFSDTLGL